VNGDSSTLVARLGLCFSAQSVTATAALTYHHSGQSSYMPHRVATFNLAVNDEAGGSLPFYF
jgi:hypothetical protein